MTDPNTNVRNLLESLVQDGGEIGVQVAAYLDGDLVIDAWAGLADEASQRPVDGETLLTAFSISKGMTAYGSCQSPLQSWEITVPVPPAFLW
jgi:CubicO group peptidase (beta-lactamase class C family)